MHGCSDMMRVVLAQYAIAVLAARLGALFFGEHAGWSALLGGLPYALMTTILAAILLARRQLHLSASAGVMVMLLGEFVKIMCVILLLLLASRLYGELNWPAFLIALIAVVNSYFVLLLKKN